MSRHIENGIEVTKDTLALVRTAEEKGAPSRIVEAVEGLFAKTGTSVGEYTHALLYGPDPRSHGGVARRLGLGAEQLGDPLFGRLGNAGVAFAPLQLIAALESAGYTELSFGHFPFPYRHLDVWGHVVTARA